MNFVQNNADQEGAVWAVRPSLPPSYFHKPLDQFAAGEVPGSLGEEVIRVAFSFRFFLLGRERSWIIFLFFSSLLLRFGTIT